MNPTLYNIGFPLKNFEELGRRLDRKVLSGRYEKCVALSSAEWGRRDVIGWSGRPRAPVRPLHWST